jgi:hypothetical protein
MLPGRHLQQLESVNRTCRDDSSIADGSEGRRAAAGKVTWPDHNREWLGVAQTAAQGGSKRQTGGIKCTQRSEVCTMTTGQLGATASAKGEVYLPGMEAIRAVEVPKCSYQLITKVAYSCEQLSTGRLTEVCGM